MGNCSACGVAVANVMYAAQKVASCCALTAVIGMLVFTMIVALSVGVGLGYHYCVVEFKTYKLDEKQFRAEYGGGRRVGESRRFGGLDIEPTMVVRLDDDSIDFSVLFSKIKTENKNVTLHLVAT